jgi:hypothetical protein
MNDEVVVYSKKRNYTIWRVQDDCGEGPYRDIMVEDIIGHHDSDKVNHPAPMFDKGIMRDAEDGEICGFISEWQLRQWFTRVELNKLRQYGYHIVKLEVKKITAVGEKQILARK